MPSIKRTRNERKTICKKKIGAKTLFKRGASAGLKALSLEIGKKLTDKKYS